MERWDLYDKNRKFLNKTIKRGEKTAEGEYYVAVEIWTVNSRNQILVTRRDFSKRAGGYWEFTGGGVLSGEKPIEAARRELEEEVGIAPDMVKEFSYLATYSTNQYFMDIFLCRADISTEALTLQEGEVIDAKWVELEEVERMIENGSFVESVGIRFRKYKNLITGIEY